MEDLCEITCHFFRRESHGGVNSFADIFCFFLSADAAKDFWHKLKDDIKVALSPGELSATGSSSQSSSNLQANRATEPLDKDGRNKSDGMHTSTDRAQYWRQVVEEEKSESSSMERSSDDSSRSSAGGTDPATGKGKMASMAHLLSMSMYVVTVNCDFEAASENELTIHVGDRVIVQDQSGGEWWYGMLENSKQSGWFPSDYVDP